MTTPLIMLGILIGPWLVERLFSGFTDTTSERSRFMGCLGIALVFGFTGLGHFIRTDAMTEMLPEWMPARALLVYVTGVIEIVAAIAVLIPQLRRVTGWGLIVMLILFLPVNVYAAWNRIGMGGHEWGPVYLLVRVPLQVILIAWIWWFTARRRFC